MTVVIARCIGRGFRKFLVLLVCIGMPVFLIYYMDTSYINDLTVSVVIPIKVSNTANFNTNCSKSELPITGKYNQRKSERGNTDSIKYVHYYNKPGFVKGNIFSGCKFKCKLTWKPTVDYQTSDAMMFHGPGIKQNMKPPKKRNGQIWNHQRNEMAKYGTTKETKWPNMEPPKKRNGQIWIIHSKESAANYPSEFLRWKKLFNWTISYRRDSDVMAMNGVFKERKSKANQGLALLSSKSKSIAWFVANCKTPAKREIFVKSLSKAGQVIDIFGRCGTHRCPRNREKLCMEIIRKNYKFYLSFENSLCHDYITEKSFKIYENLVDAIPITRGVGEQYKIYLPPNSYISTKDFKSAEELSKFIKRIETNITLWESFHWWRNYYEAHIINYTEFCELCKRLHHPDKYKRLYAYFGSWKKLSGYKIACKTPTDAT